MDKAKRRDSQHHLQAFDSFEVYHDARVQRVRVENLGLGAHMQIGTRLKNEYGIWTIVNITHFDGSTWYDIKGERGTVVAYPSQIGTHYTVVK